MITTAEAFVMLVLVLGLQRAHQWLPNVLATIAYLAAGIVFYYDNALLTLALPSLVLYATVRCFDLPGCVC